MKKKLFAVLLSAAMVASLAGCGSGNDDTEATEAVTETTEATATYEDTHQTAIGLDLDPEECVTKMCEYKGIEVSLTGDYEVTDEAVEDLLNTLLSNEGLDLIEVTDRTTVKDTDVVAIDYVGKVDGEAFDNGSGSCQFDIANNGEYGGSSYIDGFSDGLAGAELGSTITTPVTFPEDYSDESLAGQDATFDITINTIYEKVDSTNLTDDMVAENLSETYGVSTVDDLVSVLRSYLEGSAMESYVQQYLLDNCEVTIPEGYVEAQLDQYQERMAATYGSEETFESLLSMNGYTIDTWREYMEESINESLELNLVCSEIAILEGIDYDEDGFNEYVQNYIDSGDYSSYFTDVEGCYEYFGDGDAESGEEYLKKLYPVQQGYNFAIDNAVLDGESGEEVVEAEETVEDAEDAEAVESTEE